MTLNRLRTGLDRLLEVIVIALVVGLTLLVIAGFCFRYVGYALSWYDEIASVGLVWLTYYGSALAAARGAHIGVPGFVNAMPPALRLAATILAETCVFVFMILLAWTGFEVMQVMAGEYLVSLDWMPQTITTSAVPIGAVLFVLAEALRLPKVLRDARSGGFIDTETIEAMSHGAPETAGEAR